MSRPSKGKKLLVEFIVPFVVMQALVSCACAGWVHMWLRLG